MSESPYESVRGPVATTVVLLCAFTMLLIPGCGFGTAGLGGALGGSSSSGAGPGNADPVITSVQVSESRVSPAIISFNIIDAESDPADVQLFYEVPGDPARNITGGALDDLASSPNPGVMHQFSWDFASEVGLDSGFQPGVQIGARLVGVTGSPEANPLPGSFMLGNDAPVIVDDEVVPSGNSGNVVMSFSVSDTSADPVSITAEFRINTVPPGPWQTATVLGEIEDQPTTDDAAGEPMLLVWLSEVDIPDQPTPVVFRLTPDDDITEGTPAISPELIVDNNAAPIAILDSGSILTNPDRHRGLPIPFQIIDDENDPVTVVLQWRRAGQSYPDLPADAALIPGILDDPEQRRLLQIAEELAPVFTGAPRAAVTADPLGVRIRLPELGSSAAALAAEGVDGRELQILRASTVPAAVASSWTGPNVLDEPVAAVPVAGGETALILDVPAVGSWRLREVNIGTGSVVRDVATGVGDPNALAPEPGGDSVLVASDESGTWTIRRVDLESDPAVVTTLHTADGSTELGPVQGLVSLGSTASLTTVGNSLIRVEYEPPSREVALPVVLAGPRGVIRDPLKTNRFYLAEHDFDQGAQPPGRVIAIEIDSFDVPPLLQTLGASTGFPRPSAIALEDSGARLIVLTENAGSKELRGLDVGGAEQGEVFVIGSFPLTARGLATGPDGLRLVPFETSPGDVAVGGGVEQSRIIADGSFDAATQEVSVTAPFDPPLSADARTWRIFDRLEAVTRSSDVFVWDTAAATLGDDLFLKLTPYDSQLGVPNEITQGKELVAFDETGIDVTSANRADAAIADLDGDGDLDLAVLGFGSLEIFFQTSSGTFPDFADVFLGSAVLNDAAGVEAGDLNGDGKIDLIAANVGNDNLTVFLQPPMGYQNFGGADVFLGETAATDGPEGVELADLDGDGALDVISANAGGDDLSIFFQPPGGFQPGAISTPDLVVGDGATTIGPRDVIAADVDGDGKLDLVSANTDGNSSDPPGGNVTVFFQKTSPVIFDAVPDLTIDGPNFFHDPYSVAAADLNGDGRLDLVSGNEGGLGATLTVSFQVAPGVFNPTPDVTLQISSVALGRVDVAAGDIDGDGDMDLISANLLESTLSIFSQSSPGEFAPEPDTLATDVPDAVEARDLDGDGDLDLVAASVSGSKLTIFSQSSPGRFATTPGVSFPFAILEAPTSAETADLDGDGDLDLILASSINSSIDIYFQTSPGVFPEAPDVSLGGSVAGNSLRPSSLRAVDIDGDGDLDLASANSVSATASRLALYLQPPGGFSDGSSPDVLLGDATTTVEPNDLEVVDLNDDGRADLISANTAGNDLTVFLQPVGGYQTTATPDLVLGGPGVTGGPRSVNAADIDGDGALDVVSANSTGNNLTVFLQPSGGFQPGAVAAPDMSFGTGNILAPFSLAVADFDRDGALDLASANRDGDNLTVFLQPDGGFPLGDVPDPDVTLGNSFTTIEPESLAAADLDGDGDLDFVSANAHFSSPGLTIFLQTSPGSWPSVPSAILTANSTRTESVTTADLDGDGDLDIIATGTGSMSSLDIFYGSH